MSKRNIILTGGNKRKLASELNDQEKRIRVKYFDYLYYHQGNFNEPTKTYVDWSGDEILSYEAWKERFKNMIDEADHIDTSTPKTISKFKTVVETDGDCKRIKFKRK